MPLLRSVLLCLLLAAPAGAAPRVVIDPGHGGAQEGAAGLGLDEKDLALQLALRLKDALAGAAEVTLTREDDTHVELADRVARANARRVDLFISLHANSMPTRRQRARTQGIETYFLSASASGEDARRTAAQENGEARGGAQRKADDTLGFILADLQRQGAHADSSRLAYAVHQRLVKATGALDRGVQQAPFTVLTGVDAPAILVEVGFISHPTEGLRLKDPRYQASLAGAIAEGVKAFMAEVAARESRGQRVVSPGAP
ncbi:MAG: N-acetylmuramoyl-L-alanine amidase [Myxococcaceae bacterium]|nr:N-acetylmuramoyl-L-alanine amidase [Myxococcaceae bacterium]MCI0671424.1 N-acetylmuramoyl-L-alanine amidase [Myxococcaceae bacterium]